MELYYEIYLVAFDKIVHLSKTIEKSRINEITAYYTRKPRRCLSKIPIWRE